MDASTLTRLVVGCRPAEVPVVLNENIETAVGDNGFSVELLSLPLSPQRMVATAWVTAVDVTNGAFWDQSAGRLRITPFGQHILSEAALWSIDEAGASLEWQPTKRECHVLSERLRTRLDEAGVASYFTMVFGWLCCVALANTPRQYSQSRHNLAVSAVKLTGNLQEQSKTAEPLEQQTMSDCIFGLYAAAVSGFPPESEGWGRCHLTWAMKLDMLFDEKKEPSDLSEALYHYEEAERVLDPRSMEGLTCKFMHEKALVKHHGTR